MEDKQDRSSPPLSSRGYYSLDFDALDDNLNPFPTKTEIKSSPPLKRKGLDNKIEAAEQTIPANNDTNQDDNRSSKETRSTPKKRKSKSPSCRETSIMIKSDSFLDARLKGVQLDDSGDGVDKPVKHKKSGKKLKSRPMSKSFEEQDIPDKAHHLEDSANMNEAVPQQPTSTNPSSNIPQDSIPTEEPEKGSVLSEKHPAHKQKEPQPKKTPEQSESVPCPEPTHQTPEKSSSLPDTEKTPPPQEKSPPMTKKHRSISASIVSEGGSEIHLKKDRNSGKVRRSKSKKSSSSSRQGETEGNGDGERDGRGAGDRTSTSDHKREKRHSRRRSSQGDVAMLIEPIAGLTEIKSKSPSTHAFEAQPGQPVARGETSMTSSLTSSHSKESVVKLVQVLKYSQSDWNKLRQELEGNFQAQLLVKEREWSCKMAERDARLAAMEDTNKKLRQTNEDMKIVMGEFEKTIGQLQSEKEKTKNASQQSLRDVVKEKEQAVEDLRSVETAFSDLHRRYEKTKAVVDGFKQNEDVLKKCVQDLQNKVKKSEQKMQILKVQAEEKLDRASEQLGKAEKASASEIARLEAALRKAHVQIESTEASLEQKVKENKELAAICDELIAKVQ